MLTVPKVIIVHTCTRILQIGRDGRARPLSNAHKSVYDSQITHGVIAQFLVLEAVAALVVASRIVQRTTAISAFAADLTSLPASLNRGMVNREQLTCDEYQNCRREKVSDSRYC